jgi:hypothetical protein
MWIQKAKQAFAWWPLRIVCFVLAVYLAVGLIAAVTWFEFGRSAEEQVVDLATGLTELVGIILVPILLVGLIAVPFYRWIIRKIVNRLG